MKKLLALVLCAVMVLAMIPAVTLTASAAGEGDWTTRRSPKDYDDPDDYCPAGGFYYDSEGFHTLFVLLIKICAAANDHFKVAAEIVEDLGEDFSSLINSEF